MNHLRIRRVVLLLIATVGLAGCGSGSTPVPGNGSAQAPAAASGSRIAPLAASKPVGLTVPAIGVTANRLLDLGLDATGALDVPPDATDVGWFDLSPAPGSLGPSILAAHVDYAGTKGPFSRLHELEAGDEITVRRADGSTAVFETYRIQRYPKSRFPTDQVYGDTAGAELRLITCGGVFDRGTGQYQDNVVAYARLVGAR